MIWAIWIFLTYVGDAFWRTVIFGIMQRMQKGIDINETGKYGVKSAFIVFLLWVSMFAQIFSAIIVSYDFTKWWQIYGLYLIGFISSILGVIMAINKYGTGYFSIIYGSFGRYTKGIIETLALIVYAVTIYYSFRIS